MKNELEKKKYRICGFVGIDPNTDSFKWLSDEFDGILDLFHQEQTKLIEEIRHNFIHLAIKGKDDPDTEKGALLYARTLKYLEDLKKTL